MEGYINTASVKLQKTKAMNISDLPDVWDPEISTGMKDDADIDEDGYIIGKNRDQDNSEDEEEFEHEDSDKEEEEKTSILSDIDEKESSAPKRRRLHTPQVIYPQLPDLRFEESYLASLKVGPQTWRNWMWITFRDQVVLCGVQGFAMSVGWIWMKSILAIQKENGAKFGIWLNELVSRAFGRDI